MHAMPSTTTLGCSLGLIQSTHFVIIRLPVDNEMVFYHKGSRHLNLISLPILSDLRTFPFFAVDRTGLARSMAMVFFGVMSIESDSDFTPD